MITTIATILFIFHIYLRSMTYINKITSPPKVFAKLILVHFFIYMYIIIYLQFAFYVNYVNRIDDICNEYLPCVN